MNFVDGSFWHLAANVRFQTHADMPISDFFVHAPYRVRGRDFPLAHIAQRLRCPRCGCRRVGVMFGPPSTFGLSAAAAAMPYRDWRYRNDADD
jgi:hypothetical protein